MCDKNHKETPTKLCINQQCNLANQFICQQCEEQHEHEGTLVAVRIKKVYQILSSIKRNRTNINQITEIATKTLNSIKQQINNYISLLANEDNILIDLETKIGKFIDDTTGCHEQKFGQIWKQIKNNNQIIDKCHQNSQRIDQLNRIQDIILNNSEQKQEISNSSFSGGFLEKFSEIISFLNLEMKTKPRIPTLESIKQLAEEYEKRIQGGSKMIKYQGLCLAKVLQICEINEKAERIYSKLQETNNFDLQIINKKVLLHKKMGKYNQACEDLTQLISLVAQKIPNPKIYLSQRAQIYKLLKQWEKAQKDLLKCLQNQDDQSKDLQKSLIEVFENEGKYQDAIKWTKKVLNQQKNVDDQAIIQAYTKMISYAKLMGNAELQQQFYNVIRQKKTEDLELLLKRAPVSHTQGKYWQAVEDYSKILQKIPDNPSIFYNRAVSLIYLNKKQSAIKDLEIAHRLNPKFQQALNLLANLAFEQSQSQLILNQNKQIYRKIALKAYLQIVKQNENNHLNWHNIGILYNDEDTEKAFNAYNKAIEKKPDFMASYLGKIKTSLTLKHKPQKILKDIYQAIALGNRNAQIFHIKAILEEQLNQFDKALETLNLVLKADPNNIQYIQSKIRLLVKLKRQEEAVAQVQRLNTISPQRAKQYLKQPEELQKKQ